jgi:hypothetical protein
MYLQRQPNDTLDTSSGRTFLRLRQSGLQVCWSCKELTYAQFWTTPKFVRPTTYQTWILPSSCQLGVLHLIIHVKYVRGHTMLIRCCFVIIVSNDGYHLFCLKLELIQVLAGIWYCPSCFPTTPWILFIPCRTFPGSSLGGGYMRISSQPPLVHCIYTCMHLFLVD